MEVSVCTHRGYGYVKCAFLSNVPMFKKNPGMSFAIFGNFEVDKDCHFWQFLDSIITDEGAKYCQIWQKSDLSSL